MNNVARMMGLSHDPDEFPGKYTLFESEERRRVWWEVYWFDLCAYTFPLPYFILSLTLDLDM